jgi:hypothetical protein
MGPQTITAVVAYDTIKSLLTTADSKVCVLRVLHAGAQVTGPGALPPSCLAR